MRLSSFLSFMLSLLLRYWHLNRKKQFAYPGNVLTGVLTLPLMIGMEFLSIYLTIFVAGGHIGVWQLHELAFVLINGILILYMTSFFGIYHPRVSGAIYQGQIDFFLIKPKPFFLLFFGEYFVFLNILRMGIIAGILLYFAPVFAPFFLSFLDVAIYLFILISSTFFFLTLYFIILSFQFYGNSQSLLNNILVLTEITKQPKEFYPTWVQWIFTFLCPLFLITNPLFNLMHHRYDLSLFLTTLTAMGVITVLSGFLWKRGMKNYTSGN